MVFMLLFLSLMLSVCAVPLDGGAPPRPALRSVSLSLLLPALMLYHLRLLHCISLLFKYYSRICVPYCTHRRPAVPHTRAPPLVCLGAYPWPEHYPPIHRQAALAAAFAASLFGLTSSSTPYVRLLACPPCSGLHPSALPASRNIIIELLRCLLIHMLWMLHIQPCVVCVRARCRAVRILLAQLSEYQR